MTDESKTAVVVEPTTQSTETSAGAGTTTADSNTSVVGAQAKTEADNKVDARTVAIGEDEYDVDEKGFVKIPATAFKKRLNRYTKSQLREAFGTDNVDELKEKLTEHGKLKAKSEEERRKQLAKEEQLAEDLRKEKTAREKAEQTATRYREEREYQEAESDVQRLAKKYVDPDYIDYVVFKLGSHIRDLDVDEANRLKETDLEKWLKGFAEDHPKYSKGTKDERKAEIKKPLTHGAGDPGSPNPTQSAGGKTARPGQPNSMTDAEYREFKRQHNIHT